MTRSARKRTQKIAAETPFSFTILLNGIVAIDVGRASKWALPKRILVMRSMHIPVELDETLRDRAFFERTPRNDLSRRCIRAGMELGLGISIPRKRRRAAAGKAR